MDLDKEIKKAIECAKMVTREDLEEAIDYYEKENGRNAFEYVQRMFNCTENDFKNANQNLKYSKSEHAKGYWEGQRDALYYEYYDIITLLKIFKGEQ